LIPQSKSKSKAPVSTDDIIAGVKATKLDTSKKSQGAAPKPRKTLYWCLKISDANQILDHPTVAEFIAGRPELKPKTEFHCTLHFMGKEPVDETTWSRFEGQTFDLNLSAIGSDSDIAALVVESVPLLCSNARPHLTLAIGKGVSPVYSNTMLAGEHTRVKFDPPLVVQTIVTRVF
jgi:hypothetical protein